MRRFLVSLVALAAVSAFAQQPAPEVIDLTEPGAVASSTAEAEIIDTRIFNPQIRDPNPYTGPVTIVRDHLPIHWRDRTKPVGTPNDMIAGELTDEVRTTPGMLFPGISQSPWSPPDPTLAVGQDHIVETVNMEIAFFNKATGVKTFQQRLDNSGSPGFFESVGAGNFTFDPKCYYDHYTGRFVVVALEVYGSTQAWICIAVSDDGDPNGTWFKYRTNAVVTVGANTYWVDYPGFGYDGTAYYVTGNLFGLNNGGFGGVLFRCFDKTPLLSGGAASIKDVRDGGAASVQATAHYGTANAAFFVSEADTTHLTIHAIRNPTTTPVLNSTSVAVSSFAYPTGGAPNSGGGNIDVLDGRIINCFWRGGKLLAGHGVRLSSKNQARWYELNTNNWPISGSVTVAQQGNIDAGSDSGNAVHTWFPALAKNVKNDIGIVVAASSANRFASVRHTGRKVGDAAGTMGALTQDKIGTATASGRWGDYFDLRLDPTNDTVFWLIGEFQDAGGWSTWISSFCISFPPGDMNCDCAVDGFDIEHFVQALTDPAGYTADHPGCDIDNGDLNGDGNVDGFDIDLFVALLT
ncbi:MAG: hypothetical protein CHACPFDD_03589 [Phycisphaerae bacterium]|nr:hypothetical protein [Phycisphaerae bacterium]